jgi:hypothetical protein
MLSYSKKKRRRCNSNPPDAGEGLDQWLGDGYYFWESEDFAVWWGETQKCKEENLTRIWDIYTAELFIDGDNFIDTVFNEEDYKQFVKKIEDFATKYVRKYSKKPSLSEFNDFIADHGIWTDIEAIRFQDVPANDRFVRINGFFYKKRIQIRVNNVDLISKFAHLKKYTCVEKRS